MIPNGSTLDGVYHPTRNAFDFAIQPREARYPITTVFGSASGGGIGELGMGVGGRQYPVLQLCLQGKEFIDLKVRSERRVARIQGFSAIW